MEALTEVELKVIEVEDIEDAEKESCLVGRLVTQKSCNPSVVIRAMKKVWKPINGISSRVLGESKLILFCFDDAIERDWVLKNQPWVYKGSLFAIKKFTGGNEQLPSSSTNVTVDHTPFWARLYDVPISCMNERSLNLFAKQIGKLESVDMSGEDLFGKFVRFKISINITKPLMRGITIQVKGKHLWLPLKYESLPNYCLSCGTIDHDLKNCQSFNRNLKYGSCKLRVLSSKGKKKIEREDAPTLPHDIIEIILSRVPVKFLLRLKLVSKQWEATISNPSFAERHLQQYKKSSSRNLIAQEEWQDFNGLHVCELKHHNFHFLSAIEHSGVHNSLAIEILCYCDGLYLKCKIHRGIKTYVLWNPSCRAYQEFRCPSQIKDRLQSYQTLYGIYYNPLMKDYKVVIADSKHYAVFSCGSNEWSEVKEIDGIPQNGSCDSGVSCNGSFYWPLIQRRRGFIVGFQIICFDWKDEKFSDITIPEYKGVDRMFTLTSCAGRLCLLYNSDPNEMWIMKKVEGGQMDSWMEFRVSLPYRDPSYRCWLNEDEILLDFYTSCFMLYNLRKKTFLSIPKHRYCRGIDYPVPYLENLFLHNKRST